MWLSYCTSNGFQQAIAANSEEGQTCIFVQKFRFISVPFPPPLNTCHKYCQYCYLLHAQIMFACCKFRGVFYSGQASDPIPTAGLRSLSNLQLRLSLTHILEGGKKHVFSAQACGSPLYKSQIQLFRDPSLKVCPYGILQ